MPEYFYPVGDGLGGGYGDGYGYGLSHNRFTIFINLGLLAYTFIIHISLLCNIMSILSSISRIISNSLHDPET